MPTPGTLRSIARWAALIVVASSPAAHAAQPSADRLGDGATPVRYDLTLELDPERATFTGHVAITIAVSAPHTSELWLDATDLELSRATVDGEPVVMLEGSPGSQQRGFALPRAVDPGTLTLAIDYTGHASELGGYGKNEEGLFRERAGDRWYLYSQAESVFARMIVPCFDEPRWKPSWKVTLIVPRGQVALANAPLAGERTLPDGRHALQFAEIGKLPSYLLAVAVGPFDVVDAGKLGRNRVPARIVVARGDGKHTAAAVRELPRVVDALERYLDAPLPLAKLDLVAVPQFFGAMENPGLITYEQSVLVGGRDLVFITAHELAHQWFGDSVTPAWWEHLWLSEAFASWLGERISAELGAAPPRGVAHRARADAIAADDQPGALALIHPIARSGDVEPAFNAIAYDKGAAVLAMFERFAEAPFRAAVRAYLAAHAGTAVESAAFFDALAQAGGPALAAALASNLHHAGVPVVELALRCTGQPAVIAAVRDGVSLPVCVRFPTGAPSSSSSGAGVTPTTTACLLAGAHTELALPPAAGCPAWLAGNAGGVGYYRTLWRGGEPVLPPAQLTADERLARGDDLALAFAHGERSLPDALRDVATLAGTGEPYAAIAAITIAREIDPLVGEADRAAWARWLAARFANQLTAAALGGPPSPLDDSLREPVVDLTRGALASNVLTALRTAGAHRAYNLYLPLGIDAALDGVRDRDQLFDRLATTAATTKNPELRSDLLERLGAFPAHFAPKLADALLDPRLAAAQVAPALYAMLARGESHDAAWHAVHARAALIKRALGPGSSAILMTAAAATLCDAGQRAELVVDFADAPDVVKTARLAAIDRCIARRTTAGNFAAALAAAGPASTPSR